MTRRLRLIKVWHQDSPGIKVWVVRGWFQDFLHPKHFAAVGEKTYTGKRHLNYWNAMRDIGVILDRTAKEKVSHKVSCEFDLIEYFRKCGD